MQVLFTMEGDSLGFDFTLLYIDLVARKNNRHIFANTDEIACEIRSETNLFTSELTMI